MNITEMRQAAEVIALAAIEAVKPKTLIQKAISLDGRRLRIGDIEVELNDYKKIVVVGTGKATGKMAEAVESILTSRISEGVVVVPEGPAPPLKRIKVVESGHPIPDARGVAGAQATLSLVRQNARPDVLALCLISGGGSALLPYPAEGISLADKQKVTRLLLKCGASIFELNATRKHLSRVKGGQLARAAAPARVVSVIISDVVNNPLDTIASGLTAPDPTTFSDVVRMLRKYQIWEDVPESVRQLLTKGVAGDIPETPKPDDQIFSNVSNVVVGNNYAALHAASEQAVKLGFHPLILSSCIMGEAREVGTVFASIAKEVEYSGHPVSAPACLLAGGETTVTVRGNGTGGRNQELALSAAISLADSRNITIAAIGTDGRDGPTDAAGAMIDTRSVTRALEAGADPVDYLIRNDSYSLHRITGDLFITGPTGTNVMDLLIALVS